jgi:hypothetical protein
MSLRRYEFLSPTFFQDSVGPFDRLLALAKERRMAPSRPAWRTLAPRLARQTPARNWQ